MYLKLNKKFIKIIGSYKYTVHKKNKNFYSNEIFYVANFK